MDYVPKSQTGVRIAADCPTDRRVMSTWDLLPGISSHFKLGSSFELGLDIWTPISPACRSYGIDCSMVNPPLLTLINQCHDTFQKVPRANMQIYPNILVKHNCQAQRVLVRGAWNSLGSRSKMNKCIPILKISKYVSIAMILLTLTHCPHL